MYLFQLGAWIKGHILVLKLYKQARKFPADEKLDLVAQMRKSSTSITSNIAGRFSRKGSKEKIRFYYTALNSLTESQNQLVLARDLGYITKTTFDAIANMTVTISKLINGLIKYKLRTT